MANQDISNPIYGDIFVIKSHPKRREVCVTRVNKYEVILHNMGMDGRRLYSFCVSDLAANLELP